MTTPKKQKFYVVLKGHKPGIYSLWADAQVQIKNFSGAIFKSFESEKEAEIAWRNKRFESSNQSSKIGSTSLRKEKKPRPKGAFLVVDAACSGNPGPTEYQGFFFPGKVLIFKQELGLGNNNIGEFLAIVHAQAWMLKNGYQLPIYSDSVTAMSWVKHKKVKSELPRTTKTENAWNLVDRAIIWLNSNPLTGPIYKWETEQWGENPADFGRK